MSMFCYFYVSASEDCEVLLPPKRVLSLICSPGVLWIWCAFIFFIVGIIWLVLCYLTFVAVNVPGRPRIWLYKSIWFLISNKQSGIAWIHYTRCFMQLLPRHWALDNVTVLRSLPLLQRETVSFLSNLEVMQVHRSWNIAVNEYYGFKKTSKWKQSISVR